MCSSDLPRDGAYFVDDPGNHGRPAAERLLPLWDTPRAEVRAARVGWHRLHRNRLTIEFADGSWASFASLFHMGRRKASTVVAALNS